MNSNNLNITFRTVILSVAFFLFLLINPRVSWGQITSFTQSIKVDYLYAGYDYSDYYNAKNLVKVGYVRNLSDILGSDLSLGVGLRFGEVLYDRETYYDDNWNSYDALTYSNVGLLASLGYQFYYSRGMIEPQVNFDLSSAFSYGGGINVTLFNRLVAGYAYMANYYHEFHGIRIGLALTKKTTVSF